MKVNSLIIRIIFRKKNKVYRNIYYETLVNNVNKQY